MVSEKPPRRTRQKDDPLTIDLQADKAATEEQDTAVEKPETDPTDIASATPAETPADVTLAPEAGSATTTDQSPATETGIESPALETSTETHARPELEPEAATAASAASTEETWPRAAADRPSPKKTPPTSGLLAASILGGLIALAGAGALQYGGVLPALGPDRATPAADLSALGTRIDQLQTQIAALPAGGATVDTSILEQRLAALEVSAAQTGQGSEQTQALANVEAQQAQATDAIAALRADLAGLKQSFADMRTTTETRLADIQQKVDAPRTDLSMAKAIAVSSLKTAIDRGGPFLGELDTLSGISADDPVIAVLKPFAPTGIPARSELIRRFPAVADAILSAVNQPTESANWSDRLMASAMSIVKVRPVGNIEGESPEAIVARMEEKLRNGDLKGAAIEWQSLPQPGKTISAEFARNLDDRVTIETAVNAALANAVDKKS